MSRLRVRVLALRILAPLLAIALSAFGAEDLLRGVKVPDGYEATLFAAPPDITYPACLCAAPGGVVFVGIDENGSVDAKPGRGRVVRCVDTDGNGRADKFTVFAKMDTPRGLQWHAGTLYVVHPPFVTAYRDEDGDGVAERSEDLVTGLGVGLHAGGEGHATNGCRLGSDGWLYIAVGDSGALRAVGKDGAKIQLHGGGVVRVRTDGTGLEIVSRGQRNIYDVAVSPTLDLFTRDNTNDGGGWNTRLSHIVSGAQYGYPSLFRNFADEIVPPLDDSGPGSPAGVLWLDSPAWPDARGLLTCEWARNAVHFHPLTSDGAGWKAGAEKVLIAVPRPTDIDADGQGNLFVASWNNGGTSYSRSDVGYIMRVARKGAATEAVRKTAQADELRESALRALADDTRLAAPAQPFVQALDDPNPRVRLQAVIALRRLGKIEAAPALLSRTADSDPLVAHVAVNALAELRAADACLAALDDAGVRAGALRALQTMHEPAVADALLARLAASKDATPIFTALCRLARREGEWDGRWWGVRPDTAGPYFKPERWAASDRIETALKQALTQAAGDTRRALIAEVQRHRVSFPGFTAIALQGVGEDSAARLAAVEALAAGGDVPDDALPILHTLAVAATEPPELRAHAFRLLMRATGRPAGFTAAMAAFATLAEATQPALLAVWEEFTHDVRHAASMLDLAKLANGDDAPKRVLAETVLVNLAGHRLVWKEGRAMAMTLLAKAWTKPDRAAELLGVIGREHAAAFAEPVRARLKDANHTVAEAAEYAWRQLGLDQPANAGPRVEIAKLDFDILVAEVAKSPGDPALGRALYLRQGCVGCHSVAADEPPRGPALAGIATRADRRELCESIMRPNAKLAPGYETQWFATASGERVEGFVTRESGEEIEVRNVAGVVTMVKKAGIKDRGKREQSMMPGGLTGNLTVAEFASLLAYLESLRAP